jgi:hypothetical protein
VTPDELFLGERLVLELAMEIEDLVPGNGGSGMLFEQLERERATLAGAEEDQRRHLRRRKGNQQSAVAAWAWELTERLLLGLAHAADELGGRGDDLPAGRAIRLDETSTLHLDS